MAAITVRHLDDEVKRRLQVRAARHGRSMESEIRAILAEAVIEPAESASLVEAILARFGALGGVDLEIPRRSTPPRAADLAS